MSKQDLHDGGNRYGCYLDDRDYVSEAPDAFVMRMQATLLPHMPREILLNWFYSVGIQRYAFLGFESLRFEKQCWKIEDLANPEILRSRGYDGYEYWQRDLEKASAHPCDEFVGPMIMSGTWHKPIVLLDNRQGQIVNSAGESIHSPFHLLWGERELACLMAMHHRGWALPAHFVWLSHQTKVLDAPQ